MQLKWVENFKIKKKLDCAVASVRLLKKVDITAIKQKQMLCGKKKCKKKLSLSVYTLEKITSLKSTIFLHIFGSEVFIISYYCFFNSWKLTLAQQNLQCEFFCAIVLCGIKEVGWKIWILFVGIAIEKLKMIF